MDFTALKYETQEPRSEWDREQLAQAQVRWRRKLQGTPEGFSDRFVQRFIVTLEDHPELVDALRDLLGISSMESPATIPVEDVPAAIIRAQRHAVQHRASQGRRSG